MSPQQRYADDLKNSGFVEDTAQYQAVMALQQLYETLQTNSDQPAGWFDRLMGRKNIIPGLYLWGGVGRGKTYLMDLFYESLECPNRTRVHYHRFMADIHERLRHLPKSPNPLPIIGKAIAEQSRILCLDEFHVTDVADAMLLIGLLRALFEHRVTLVVTSNTRIDELYRNGFQRERFMEAIHLLKYHTTELDLAAGQDYRLTHLEQGNTYIISDAQSSAWLKQKFKDLAPGSITEAQPLVIYHRSINTVAISDEIVWFDFDELCNTPRAAKDYLALAKLFHSLFISDIPMMRDAQDSAAKRFMHLIDALYDHRVKLIASAAAKPETLYSGRLLQNSFNRTVSRLIEMSSHDYLATRHKP